MDLAIPPAVLGYADEVEKAIVQLPPVEMPVTHHFTPGLYSRQIFMPAGTLCSSKIHKTEHPYAVMQGRCVVWSTQEDKIEIEAPYFGITKPGTKRFLYIKEDTVWITFHVTDKTDVLEIENDIIEPHENQLLNSEEQLRIVNSSK